MQLDAVGGCPSLLVPKDHLAHLVRNLITRLDLTSVESTYSSLGRRGFRPQHKLGALVLGSLLRMHHSTKLAAALKTDAALRLVAGGHVISAGVLRAFRRQNSVLFADCIEQVVAMAVEEGLIEPTQLAVDSMRLRAHASRSVVRTKEHARKRIEKLMSIDPATLSSDEQEAREQSLARNRAVLAACQQSGRTSIVRTNPSAAVMMFPTGASAPGHRITVTASGAKTRIVVSVLVDADTTDYGKLRPALEQTRAVLRRAGIPSGVRLCASADAGYGSEADLAFAESSRAWLDTIVPANEKTVGNGHAQKYFGHDRFTVLPDGKLQCPSGATMQGPSPNGDGRVKFRGVGCGQCLLRSQCTESTQRVIILAPRLERLRSAMRRQLEEPGIRQRYSKRMATVEPVFSNLQDVMMYRRASSRSEESVIAEVLLKILAHNISRLVATRRAKLLFLRVEIEF
jgi:transposase